MPILSCVSELVIPYRHFVFQPWLNCWLSGGLEKKYVFDTQFPGTFAGKDLK